MAHKCFPVEYKAMDKKSELYIVDSRVLPEVFGKVMAVKKLIAGDEALTVQEAAARVGISRSAFYKYRDCIRSFLPAIFTTDPGYCQMFWI